MRVYTICLLISHMDASREAQRSKRNAFSRPSFNYIWKKRVSCCKFLSIRRSMPRECVPGKDVVKGIFCCKGRELWRLAPKFRQPVSARTVCPKQGCLVKAYRYSDHRASGKGLVQLSLRLPKTLDRDGETYPPSNQWK